MKKPVDNLDKIKRQKARRKDKHEYYGEVKPLPDVEREPLKWKRSLTYYFYLLPKKILGDMAYRFEMRFSMAITEAIKSFVLYYGWIFVIVILVGIAMYMSC